MTGPVPRVRRSEVRRRLLDAAAEVFAQRGYQASRLDEIAHAAGFTKGAVYSNFTGKHALLAELIEEHVRNEFSTRTVEIRNKNSPEWTLEGIAEIFARGVVEESMWTRLLTEIAQQSTHDPEVRAAYIGVRRALRAELADIIKTACTELGVELTIPAEQLALMLQSLRLGLSLEHGTDPQQVDKAAVIAIFANALYPAMSRPEPADAHTAATRTMNGIPAAAR